MFLKVQMPDGSWDIREAKTIQYSDAPYLLTSDDYRRSPQQYSPFIPVKIQKALERTDIHPNAIEVISFQSNLIHSVIELPNQSNEPPRYDIKWDCFPSKHMDGFPYCNVVFPTENVGYGKPPEWECNPLYSYAILDNSKAIVFPTKAYVLNDDGKTIAKIG